MLFDENGQPQPEYANHPGIEGICHMIGTESTKQDIWLIFEVCDGEPLSQLLW